MTLVTLVVMLQPEERTAEILARVSANLDNLRAEPLVSMLGSAFVVESVWGLALVVQLLVVLAYLQRFVGRLASVVVGLAGHVGAGLVVAAGLATGIFHGFVDESVAAATDVGVSYVMAAAMGFLVLAVPPRWRWWYLGATAVYWLLPGAIIPDVHRRRPRERADHRAPAGARRRPRGRRRPPRTRARRRGIDAGQSRPRPGSAVRITMRVHAPR